MKITKTRLVKLVKEELNAVLREEEEGWPKEVKKGRFTRWCKDHGFAGPGIGCAEKAMDSDDDSVRGMAAFYMNTVKPRGKDLGDISEDTLGDDEDVVTTEDPAAVIDSMVGEGMDSEMDAASLAALADMLLPKLMKLLGKDEDAGEDDEG